MGMAVWRPLAWPRWHRLVSAAATGYKVTLTQTLKHYQHYQELVNIMIRAALLILHCVLLCHAKEANIKFISGPEVITDLGKYPPSLCTLQNSSNFDDEYTSITLNFSTTREICEPCVQS